MGYWHEEPRARFSFFGYDAPGHLLGAYDLPGEAEPLEVDIERDGAGTCPRLATRSAGEPILAIRETIRCHPDRRQVE
jgi:hypothetical protein